MSRNLNIGILILRVSIGLMLLLHGFAKISNGFAGIKGMLAGMGLPEFLACGDICSLSPMGGWAIELPMLFFFPAVALVFTGGGKYIIASRTCLD